MLVSIVAKYLIAKEKREKRAYVLLAQQVGNYGANNTLCGFQIMANLMKKSISVRMQMF